MDKTKELKDLRLHSWGPVLYPPSPCNTIEILSPERPQMLETTTYIRKPFNIQAVQVTGVNLEEVALWTNGEIRTDENLGQQYIKVKVHRAIKERQTRAYPGDWVLYAGTGFKCYTDKAFKDSFEQTGGESVMIDVRASKKSETEIIGSVEGDVVVPKRVPKKAAKSA